MITNYKQGESIWVLWNEQELLTSIGYFVEKKDNIIIIARTRKDSELLDTIQIPMNLIISYGLLD